MTDRRAAIFRYRFSMRWGRSSTTSVRLFAFSLIVLVNLPIYRNIGLDETVTLPSTPSQMLSENSPRSSPSLLRAPMKSTPDEIHASVHAPSSLFLEYLHENYLQFFANIDEVADSTAYLSDAAVLCDSATDSISLPDRIQLDRSCWHAAPLMHIFFF